MTKFLCSVILPVCLAFVSCVTNENHIRLTEQESEITSVDIDSGWVVVCDGAVNDSCPYSGPFPAVVPGTVHTDLMSNGLIVDPFASSNENALQWIEGEDWIYSTTFCLSHKLRNRSVKELIFKGLDTYADVYLNDSLILQADNMFVEWRVDVSDIVRPDSNRLVVSFASAYRKGVEKAAKYNIKLPADNDKGDVATSVFTRKAPYHFGWDWGPRLLGCGIYRPIELVGWNNARIDDVRYTLQWYSDAVARYEAKVKIISTSDNNQVHLLITDSTGSVYRGRKIEVNKGDTTVNIYFSIRNPKLWWPNGVGEAHLYTVHTILANKNDMNKLDCRINRLGVRTAELIQRKDTIGDGRSFYFRINGEPIFAKGANYIPLDVFLPRVTPDRYEEFIKACKESNFNMLRVWGGGVYESDLFYDLCDRYGIMVWQDFMFSCSFYPWDEEFLKNVGREVRYNVRRLRNHPSIVLWCGNNEISEAWHHWGYQKAMKWSSAQQDSVLSGYRAVFEQLIPEILASEDTTRAYHPSSPLYGRGNPKSRNQGDSHYWGVFHDEEPFSAYASRPGRFNSEYGFQSLACYDTYREYLAPSELTLDSPSMMVHQKNPKGYRVIEAYMSRDLPVRKDDLRTYVYLSQLLQAEGMKVAIEAHRLNRPFTMGTLYWQANDCWPAASWSSIDSRGRWKALQYYARRLFQPVALAFQADAEGCTIKLWAFNDRLQDTTAAIDIALYDFNGREIRSEKIIAHIPRASSVVVDSLLIVDLLKGGDPSKVVLTARGEDISAMYYFVPLKDLKLPSAAYTLEIAPSAVPSRFDVTIVANVFLKSVLVESNQLIRSVSDAYFDMLPGERRTVRVDLEQESRKDNISFSLQSLNNIITPK